MIIFHHKNVKRYSKIILLNLYDRSKVLISLYSNAMDHLAPGSFFKILIKIPTLPY